MSALLQESSLDGNDSDGSTNQPKLLPVVLAARAGAPQAPAVRIFLGTQAEHYRAERVFFYSLQRVRNPDRRYEIYRLIDLPGFARKGRCGGIDRYRFAVPELAGRQGRAIYNDVGQLYAADPAELFDLPLGEHGYLSLLPQVTNVMLIDCERMAGCWSYASACREPQSALEALAAAPYGRWGALDPRWHARDLEYRHGQSRLLHYSTRYLQPWRPRPERLSYHHHPRAEYFHSLEQQADAAGYEVHTATSPSPGFAAACERLAQELQTLPEAHCSYALESDNAQLLLVGNWGEPADDGHPVERQPLEWLRQEDLPARDVIAASGLERMPVEDIPWLLDRLFQLGRQWVLVKAAVGPAGTQISTADGWRALLRRIARRYPDCGWQLDCQDRTGLLRRFRADFAHRSPGGPVTPRVWVLKGKHAGDNAQLMNIAESLGWPYEVKRYGARIEEMSPPWPDLVISSGRRTAPLAQEIRRRAGSRTRLVLVGRPLMPLGRFDLVLAAPQYGLPLLRNLEDLPAPFIDAPRLEPGELEVWRQRFAHLPRPWVALLVGGKSTPLQFDAQIARDLGREASDAVRARGGSLLVSTSPRTGAKAADALLAAIDTPNWCYRFDKGGDNPHRALLALADAFIVTGETVSMMTEACMTGRPVAVFPLPARRNAAQRLHHELVLRLDGTDRKSGNGGVPRRQSGFERLYDWMVGAGWFACELQLQKVHQTLGVEPLPGGLDQPPGLPPELFVSSRTRALQAIQELVTGDRPVPL